MARRPDRKRSAPTKSKYPGVSILAAWTPGRVAKVCANGGKNDGLYVNMYRMYQRMSEAIGGKENKASLAAGGEHKG